MHAQDRSSTQPLGGRLLRLRRRHCRFRCHPEHWAPVQTWTCPSGGRRRGTHLKPCVPGAKEVISVLLAPSQAVRVLSYGPLCCSVRAVVSGPSDYNLPTSHSSWPHPRAAHAGVAFDHRTKQTGECSCPLFSHHEGGSLRATWLWVIPCSRTRKPAQYRRSLR